MTYGFHVTNWTTSVSDISEIVQTLDIPDLVLYTSGVDVAFLQQYWPDATYQQVQNVEVSDVDIYVTDDLSILRERNRPRILVFVGEAAVMMNQWSAGGQ